MEKMGGTVTEAVADTYNNAEIVTPASKTEKMAMLIHAVFFFIPRPFAVVTINTEIGAQLHSFDSTALLNAFQDGYVAGSNRNRFTGAAVGDGTEQWQIPAAQYFSPPILYAKSSIWLACMGVLTTQTNTCDVAIWYTLETVSKDDFIDALVD